MAGMTTRANKFKPVHHAEQTANFMQHRPPSPQHSAHVDLASSSQPFRTSRSAHGGAPVPEYTSLPGDTSNKRLLLLLDQMPLEARRFLEPLDEQLEAGKPELKQGTPLPRMPLPAQDLRYLLQAPALSRAAAPPVEHSTEQPTISMPTELEHELHTPRPPGQRPQAAEGAAPQPAPAEGTRPQPAHEPAPGDEPPAGEPAPSNRAQDEDFHFAVAPPPAHERCTGSSCRGRAAGHAEAEEAPGHKSEPKQGGFGRVRQALRTRLHGLREPPPCRQRKAT
mmetsp:Transcript_20779/g.57801  ORF Transcript_20779/g.57801 Transcript_20779/m.57801 type:complete len:280 (+) Transcript_20779:1086-1925(+)